MTSIHCHHPAVIFDKLSGLEVICPDCGFMLVNQQCFPTVSRYLDERLGADHAALAVQP